MTKPKRDYRKDYGHAIKQLVASMEREQAQRRVLLAVGTVAIFITAVLGTWAAVEISRGIFPWVPVAAIVLVIGHRVAWKVMIRRQIIRDLAKDEAKVH